MNGQEALKYYRKLKGYSILQLAMMLELSARSITYYESGESPITSMPVSKAVEMFKLLDVNIEDFFDKYYPYKKDIDGKIQIWREKHPRILEVKVLKKRIYLRLAKIKERNNIPTTQLERLYSLFNKTFDELAMEMDEEGYIVDNVYESMVIPLMYNIKVEMQKMPKDFTCKKILEAIIKTEYSVKDIAGFCNITHQHLAWCVKGKNDIRKMHIGIVLELCYVLKLDFMEVFTDVSVVEKTIK